MNGASTEPKRLNMHAEPSPTFRTTVGNNSPEKIYMAGKAIHIPVRAIAVSITRGQSPGNMPEKEVCTLIAISEIDDSLFTLSCLDPCNEITISLKNRLIHTYIIYTTLLAHYYSNMFRA